MHIIDLIILHACTLQKIIFSCIFKLKINISYVYLIKIQFYAYTFDFFNQVFQYKKIILMKYIHENLFQ